MSDAKQLLSLMTAMGAMGLPEIHEPKRSYGQELAYRNRKSRRRAKTKTRRKLHRRQYLCGKRW
jgi:hypothetical protein